MDEIVSPYCYQPIHAQTEIRVLQLEPGHFSEPLVGKIVLCKKDTDSDGYNLEYDCVSYCWGPNENFRSLMCDGQALRITAVVGEMLRYLRHPTASINLWVDAISINQTDNEEKSVQVRRMGKIYQTANTVHVWLGPAVDEDCIDDIFAVLRQSTANQDEPCYADDQEKFWTSLLRMAPRVKDLLLRSWFTRRWVLQEVASGRRVVVHCGDRYIGWEYFARLAEVVEQGPVYALYQEYLDQMATNRYVNISAIAVLDDMRNVIQKGSDRYSPNAVDEIKFASYVFEQLLVVLLVFDHTQCTDERDRLYSLYGLYPTMGNPQSGFFELESFFPIDYELDYQTIYTRFASAAVRFGSSHQVLKHILEFGSLAQEDPLSPSWVPRWNRQDKDWNLRLLLSMVHPGLFLVQNRSTNTATHRSRAPRSTLEHWRKGCNVEACRPGFATMSYRGQLTRIIDVQVDGEYTDAISYIKSMVDCESTTNDEPLKRLVAARALAFAISNSFHFHTNEVLSINRLFPSNLVVEYTLDEEDKLIWSALEKEMGLLNTEETDNGFVHDSRAFRNEVARILPPNAFYYEVFGEPGFGISNTQVKPGDYVFRTVEAAQESTVLALVLRPCELTDTMVPERFRILGACMDYCYIGNSTDADREYRDVAIY